MSRIKERVREMFELYEKGEIKEFLLQLLYYDRVLWYAWQKYIFWEEIEKNLRRLNIK